MAIPQGRLSSEVVFGKIFDPEDRPYYGLIAYERGPIAIEDTTMGLLYQNWTMVYDSNTSELIAVPETTGEPVSVLTIPDVQYFTFTFDQAGRVSITYVTSVSSYLYWYDTAAADTVTTDLGANVITPSIALDDKRATQNTVNDMLLWYIKGVPGNYSLYMKIQRERFLIEHLMLTGLSEGYLLTVGMADNLRIHLKLSGNSAIPVPGPIGGLTSSQELAIFSNASGIGFLSLYQFERTTFDAVFGQSIDGPDVELEIDCAQSMSYTASNPNMQFRIIHDPSVCTEAEVLGCFPNGYIWGSNHYLGTPETAMPLPIQPGHPYVLAVASDTGRIKIRKETI